MLNLQKALENQDVETLVLYLGEDWMTKVWKEAYDLAYQKGYAEGYETGYETGYDEGEDDGYDDGYDVGYDAGYIKADENQSDS